MDAHLFRRFCYDLSLALTGARFEKIFELSSNIYVLSLFGNFIENKSVKRYLIVKIHKKYPFIFLSTQKVSSGLYPSAEVMRFRKYLQNKHITQTKCDYLNRTFYLKFFDDNILEINLNSGLKLVSQIPDIIQPQLVLTEEIFARLDDKDLWKDFNYLTPSLRASLKTLDYADAFDIISDLNLENGDVFLYTKENSSLASAFPLYNLQGYSVENFESSFAPLQIIGEKEVLEQFAQNQNTELNQTKNRKLKKLQKALKNLDLEEDKFNNFIKKVADAKLIQEHLYSLDKNAKQPELIFGDYIIQLDKKLTILENMQLIFKNAAKAKRGLEFLIKRRQDIQKETEQLNFAIQNTILDEPKTSEKTSKKREKLEKDVQYFTSEDGYILIRGKNAKGNIQAIKLAKGNDYWLHTANGQSAHVIIRRQNALTEVPETTLLEAGKLVAQKSPYKDEKKALIQYALVKNIFPIKSTPGLVRIDKVEGTFSVNLD